MLSKKHLVVREKNIKIILFERLIFFLPKIKLKCLLKNNIWMADFISKVEEKDNQIFDFLMKSLGFS